MARSKAERPPFHEEFAARIIEDLRRGTAPWQRPWRPGQLRSPRNPVSGTVYSGINRVMLSRQGFEDPRWMSLKQANSLECRVRKGEKSQTIVFWQFSKEEPLLDADGKPVLDAEGNALKHKVELERPIVRFSSVFHASQLEGELPPLDPAHGPDWDPNEKAEVILRNSGAVIKHNQRDRAYYSLLRDEISLPPRESFAAADGYYATALHELGHWTGHGSRLNREFGPFGSEVYAREELRAEIASWMLGQDLGVGHDPGQHLEAVSEASRALRLPMQSLAYVDSWITVLEKDPYEIVRACRDAEQIKNYVLAMERTQEREEQATMQTTMQTTQEAAREPLRERVQQAEVPARQAAEKVYLAVPYRQRNQAKAAGARWDREAKLWYVPKGADLAKLESWLPEKAPEPVKTMDVQEEFAQAIRASGLDLGEQPPIMDGKIHRVPLLDGKPGKLDGAYLGYADGVPAGFIQNHKTGEKITWKATGHMLTEEQKEILKAEAAQRSAQRQLDIAREQEKASKRALAKFVNAKEATPEQAYLKAKGIAPCGAREDENGNLLIAGQDITGHIHTLQTITMQNFTSADKRFEPGSRKTGCFNAIAPDNKLGQEPILIAEGFATAASVHMATGLPVVAAFDAGNLEPVATALREKFPESSILILADDDHALAPNVGLEKAHQAAKAVGAKVLAPTFTADEKAKGLTDFNDLHQARGDKGLGMIRERVVREVRRMEPERGEVGG